MNSPHPSLAWPPIEAAWFLMHSRYLGMTVVPSFGSGSKSGSMMGGRFLSNGFVSIMLPFFVFITCVVVIPYGTTLKSTPAMLIIEREIEREREWGEGLVMVVGKWEGWR